MRIKDKVAVITGAGKGIGEAVAHRFAEEGAKVVVCDINESDVKKVEADITARGFAAIGVKANVADTSDVENMVKQILNKFGTVDILVNNAGITRDALFYKMTFEQWSQVLDVNLTGTFNCTHSIIEIMLQKGYGKIVNISSTSRFGNVGQANYAASKAGVVGFTRSLAKELGGKGIHVNAIAPGTIDTDMYKSIPDKIKEMANLATPLRRPGTVRELANACLFLASEESSYITGQVLHVDGGMFTP